jgi:hypothetical protein
MRVWRHPDYPGLAVYALGNSPTATQKPVKVKHEEMAGRTQAMKLITQIGGTIMLTPLLVSQLVEGVGQKLFLHKSGK